MASLYVNWGRVREANCDLPRLEEGTKMVKNGIRRMTKEIPESIASQYQIGKRLDAVCHEMGKIGERLNDLHEVVNLCMEQYLEREEGNSRNADAFL